MHVSVLTSYSSPISLLPFRILEKCLRKRPVKMMAKVICVQMASALKDNILFQDVVILYPVEFFETTHQNFEILFQDDGGGLTVRYAPIRPKWILLRY
jgi:hypothetical protein